MPRGQKTCPSCGTGTGPKALTCPKEGCGHEYRKGVKKIERPTNGSGKRGFRLCPDCQAENHVRKRICECGHEFNGRQLSVIAAEKTEREERPVVEQRQAVQYPPQLMVALNGQRPQVICTPAGSCPVVPPELTPDAVSRWAGMVMIDGAKRGKIYTPDALRYWLKSYLPDMSWRLAEWDELSEACERLRFSDAA